MLTESFGSVFETSDGNQVVTRMKQRVSIIIPAYNAARYIGEAIASVQSQTFPDWELIVVDDGSSDGTAQIIGELAKRDKRIRSFSQPNAGQGAARNAGINVANAPLIAFLDADDVWLENKLERQIEVQRETQADLVYSDAWIFNGENVTDEQASFNIESGLHTGREMFRKLFDSNSIPMLTVIARRATVLEAGAFNSHGRFSEDYDLWMRLAAAGASFYGINEKLARYRRHHSSSAFKSEASDERISDNANMYIATLRLLERHQNDSLLDAAQVKKRIIVLHQTVITALCREGRFDEAADYAARLSEIDARGLKTFVMRMMLKASPHRFIQIQNYLRAVADGRRKNLKSSCDG